MHAPRIRRLAGVLAICTVLVIVAVGCKPVPARSGSPQNGRLPPTVLVKISDSCYVVREIAGPMVLMMREAYKAGVKLRPETSAHLPPNEPQPPRIESCYRTYAMQEWWRNFYCSKGMCGFAAVPGTSRHGWGKAVDFEDQQGELRFDSPGYAWLKANAARFGFRHPDWAEPGGGSPEAWHWEAG